MTTAPPRTFKQEVEDVMAWFGCTEQEAAEKVRDRHRKAADREAALEESTDPEVLLPAIREALGLRAKIERIVKTISTPALYRFETDAGVVPVGPASRWATRPAEFSAAFLDICEKPQLPKPGPDRDRLCTMIARAAVPEDVGEEATDEGWTRAMLRQYLDLRRPVDDLDDALASEYPFRLDGRVHIFGPAFTRWLLLTFQERLGPRDLGVRLRSIGAEPDKINVGTGPDRTSRQVWRLPRTLEPTPRGE